MKILLVNYIIGKMKDKLMDNEYIISDTHFFDKKIIAYENRPFNDEIDMNEQLIDLWNNRVDDSDIVYHLGDFAFENCTKDKLQILINRLKGKKILLLGNHDLYLSSKNWQDLGFYQAIEYPIIVDNFYIFSHYPLYINNNMPYANLFGHVHNNPSYCSVSNKSFCVCAERINFTPINFKTVKKLIKDNF